MIFWCRPFAIYKLPTLPFPLFLSRRMGNGKSNQAPAKGPVRWFQANTADSKEWQNLKVGFGPDRNKSFREGVTIGEHVNREGNRDFELDGKIKFFTRAGPSTDYAKIADAQTIQLQQTEKLYAKAFLGVPLGRIPIGENNLEPSEKYPKKRGPVLLAAVPRLVALFVDVDGIQMSKEILCQSSIKDVRLFYDELGGDVTPVLPDSAVKGSFVTFAVPRTLDAFFFLHLPVVCRHQDCAAVQTGSYSLTVARAFTKLFGSLKPGPHQIRIRLKMYYDHTEYSYLALDKGCNPKSVWHNHLENGDMKEPHTDPGVLESTESPLAEGTVTVVLPSGYQNLIRNLLDRHLPCDVYSGADKEDIRGEAKVNRRHEIYMYISIYLHVYVHINVSFFFHSL